MIRAAIFFALCLQISIEVQSKIASADEPTKDLLNAVQGSWQRTFKRGDSTIRVIKKIDENWETVSYMIGDDVVQSHRVEFDVRSTPLGNVFSSQRKEFLAGPNAGKKTSETGSYLFKLEGNQWYEVHRMMPGDQGEPWINVYTRSDSIGRSDQDSPK